MAQSYGITRTGIALTLAFLLLIICPRPVAAGQITQEYSFNQPALETISIDGQRFDRIVMPAAPNEGEPGQPALPASGARLLIPYGERVEKVEVIPGERMSLGADYRIEPAQYPVILSADPGQYVAAEPDPAIYGANRIFPAERYVEVGVFAFRGYAILTLSLAPVEYNPVTGELAYYSTLTIRVTTEPADSDVSLFRGLTIDSHEAELRVDNVDAVTSYAVAAKSGAKNLDFLIITTPEFVGAFEPLELMHDSNGIITEIVTSAEIGGTDPGLLRDYIRERYLADGLEYVLIGGDDEIFPARDLYASFQTSDGPEADSTIPGDLYYGCLDGSFDFDGDGVYGEGMDGEGGTMVDMVAEVYIGRASVSTVEEAERFVSKTLWYMTHRSNYLERVLLVGEHLGFGGLSEYAANSLEQLVDECSDDDYFTSGIPSATFDIDELYDRDWGGNDWPVEELHNRMNAGRHIISHFGHCNSNWALKMSGETLQAEVDNDDLFFLYSQGCMPGAFDWGDCWAEKATVKFDHGAFALVMNARFGLGKSNSTDGNSQRFNREFWDAIYNPAENIPELGRANSDSKEDNLYRSGSGSMRWCYYELNLFGDPTLRLWDHWIIIDNFAFSDVQGDDDGILEAGETIELIIDLRNNGIAAAEDVSVTISISDVSLNLRESAAELGTITDGGTVNNAAQPFVFDIPADYETRVDRFYVEVSWTEGGVPQTEMLTIDSPIGAVPILVMDDDNGGAYESYYLEYLNDCNLPYKVWDSPLALAPTAADLLKYSIVIWFTGDISANPIDTDEAAGLQGFLDGGGKLFLTGQAIAARLNSSNQAFLNDYLHAEYSSSVYWPLLTPTPEAQMLTVTDTVNIQGGADNQSFPDRILPLGGAVGELKYLGYPQYAAISFTGPYQLVFMSFGLESVDTDNIRWAKRDSIYADILNFFEYTPPAPTPQTFGMIVTPGDNSHMTNHTPVISWSYTDPGGAPQAQYQIQVGYDAMWMPDNMWDSGPVTSTATSVAYDGLPLADGQDYAIRVRSNNGALWSDWQVCGIHMNSIPQPVDLSPSGMDDIAQHKVVLTHASIPDTEGDALVYSYELYDDPGMVTLIENSADKPAGGDAVETWVVSMMLAVGEDYYWRVRAADGLEIGEWSDLAGFVVSDPYVCGDANGDQAPDVGDAVYIINYVFKDGAAPYPLAAGDTNCDEQCNVGDAVYLINYVFKGGQAPCFECP